jgi:hypothetical protein
MFKNEKYLKGYDINSDFLMELFIESNRIARNESISNNYLLYEEYIKFIKNVVVLMKELGITSSIDYAYTLEFLIHRGILSTEPFSYKRKIDDILGIEGASVILGGGECRNFAKFYDHVFYNAGFSIADCHCNDYRSAYLRDIMPANHVINVINCDDVRYGFDAYNKRIYKFLNPFELEDIESNQRLLFKFHSQIKYNGDYNSIIRLLDSCSNSSCKESITKEELICIRNRINNLLDSNKKVLDDFCSDTKNDKENIKRLMLR